MLLKLLEKHEPQVREQYALKMGWQQTREDGPVSSDRYAEMGLVFLALTSTAFDPGDLCELDFYYEDCKLIFGEYLRMREEGVPATEVTVQKAWFKRPEVLARVQTADLAGWFDAGGKPRDFPEIFQLVIDQGFATIANVDWFKSEARKWRVVRGIRYVAHHAKELIDSDCNAIQDALAFLQDSTPKLQALAASITPSRKV